MDFIWIIVGIVLILVGIAGAIIPGIPGPIVSFVALLILQLRENPPFEQDLLVILGLIAASVTFLDYVVPIWGTKKFGGSKMGVRGSIVGLIVGIIGLPILGIVIGPFGIIAILLGPFVGAYIGESMAGKDSTTAMRSAIGSFIGFVAGTLMKLVYSFVISYYFLASLF
ncbi:MAG: DUF456 domain-containing protein [Bacteroidetes bacterium]|nr:DUF456 domain-containing protein [Bacteroidota bacterium]